MRDKNLNFIQFEQSVENFIAKKLYLSKDRRTSVVNSPTLLEQFYLVLPSKFVDLRDLCIVVHFVKEDSLRFRLLLDLEEKFHKFDLRKQRELKLLLSSKEVMLLYLYRTKNYHSSEIFGNLIFNGTKVLKNLPIRKKSSKVKYAQRKRGYDDKGSLRPREKWLESFDYSLTEEQNEKERRLELHNKTINFIIKYLKELYIELVISLLK